VLNVGNMQAIQSGFYLSHDKVFEIIRNIFGQPTLCGSIDHKPVLKLFTVKKCGACLMSFRFSFSIRQNLLHAAYKYDAFLRSCTLVERHEFVGFIFSLKLFRKMIKPEILHTVKNIFSYFFQKGQKMHFWSYHKNKFREYSQNFRVFLDFGTFGTIG
jgi:hypothetical protein